MVRDYNKFNFFALKYLDFWLGSDRQFFMEMANPEKKKRCQAAIDIAKEYKIIRGLRRDPETKLKKDRLEPVIDVLDRLQGVNFDKINYISLVAEVRQNLEAIYKIVQLSATTKLLWFRFRWPIIIYDRNACEALKKQGCRFDDRDYSAYCRCWREQFEINAATIRVACSRLPDAFAYSEFAGGPESQAKMLRVMREEWFIERVFDLFLWHKGK